jgi:hypothetical protein
MFGPVVQNKYSFSTLQPCAKNIGGQLYDGPGLSVFKNPLAASEFDPNHHLKQILPTQPTTPRFPHATATFTHFVDTFLAHPFPQINLV